MEGRQTRLNRALLERFPPWPLSPEQPGPEIVIGEVHHPVEAQGDFQPRMAHHPGARTVYRRGHLRSRGERAKHRLA